MAKTQEEILNDQLLCAARAGNLKEVEKLIGERADVNAVDSFGRTSLHFAALNRDEHLAQLLIREGANVDAVDSFERTPLHCSALKNDTETVKILIKLGANPLLKNSHDKTPRDLAKDENIKQLLKEAEEQISILVRCHASSVTLESMHFLTGSQYQVLG